MKRVALGAGLGFVLALYTLVKLFALRPAIGDENIYFYQAWRMTEGLMPYRDFVSAHPPMHLYLLGTVAAITKANFFALKTVPMLCTLGSGLCLLELCRTARLRTILPNRGWSIVLLALFLLSFDTLRISSRSTGASEATFFIALGFLCQMRSRPFLAGICYGSAAATAFYVAPVLACLLAFGLAELHASNRCADFLKLMACLAGAWVVIHLPSWLIAPRAWLEQAVLFHFKKPPIGPDFTYTFTRFLASEGAQAAACTFATALLLFDKARRRYAWVVAAALAVLPLGLAMRRVYIYYWFPAFPFFAIGTVIFLRQCWELFRVKPAPAVALATACFVVQPATYIILARAFPEPEPGQAAPFKPTPVVRLVNPAVRQLLSIRAPRWLPLPGVIRALQHENRYWWDMRPAVKAIQQTLQPAETLFGDSTTTPLLALLSRRRIAGELADTNTMQYRTGLRSLGADLQKALADNARLFVAQPRRGIYLLPEYREFIHSRGTPWRIESTGLGDVLLFLRADRTRN